MTKETEARRLADWLERRTNLMLQDRQAAAELRRLDAANAELLAVLKELKMWLPIAAELAGLDPETTEVEFEFEDGSPPKTISLKSSMNLARAAIAKHRKT